MKFNKILFVCFLYVGAQSGMILGSESEETIAVQTPQSWREWAGSYVTSATAKAQAAAAAAAKTARQAAESVGSAISTTSGRVVSGVKSAPSRIAQEAKRRYGYLTRENMGIVAQGASINTSKMLGAALVGTLLSTPLAAAVDGIVTRIRSKQHC